MKIAKFVVVSLCAVLPALAQEKKSEEPAAAEKERAWPVKVFQVKHADVAQLHRIFSTFGVSISDDRNLKVLSVRAPKEILAAIEDTIQRLDVPPPAAKNLEINAYLVLASPQGAAASIPPDLEPVIKQLKGLFSYQGFRVIGTLLLRERDGNGGSVSGNLQGLSTD